MSRLRRYLPVCLDLTGQPVLVVGGGTVGTERVRELLECRAAVTVISPAATDEIRRLADEGRIALHLREYRPGDTAGAFLVIGAVDDPAASEAIFRECREQGRLVNITDDPERCSVIFASRIDRGPLTVSLFTHGQAPVLSRRLRREMEGWLGPEWGRFAELVAEARDRLKERPDLTQPERQRLLEHLAYSELLYLLREGREEEARALVAGITGAGGASGGRAHPRGADRGTA